MSSRMRKPETTLLQITQGDWLLVKKRLTAGEQRKMFDRMMSGGLSIKPVNVGIAKIQAYLLDWSITDADDKPVVIQDQGEDVLASALDNLDPDSFKEILHAIEDHMEAVEKVDSEEKKLRAGVSASSPTSLSPEPLVGATSG